MGCHDTEIAVGGAIAEVFDLPLCGQTTGIMTVVLFGAGTDYVLFVSARFREELGRHADKHEAVRQTMRGAGRRGSTSFCARTPSPTRRSTPCRSCERSPAMRPSRPVSIRPPC